MDIIKLKTGSKFEDILNYSRLVAVGDWIYVSNTAGRNYVTRELSTDAGEQAEQALLNIERSLAHVNSSLQDTVRIVVSIPNPADKPAVFDVIGRVFKGIDPASTIHATPLANPDLKVEVELTAYRGLKSMPQTRLSVQL